MTPRRVTDRLVFATPEIAINLLFSAINAWYLFYLVQIAGLPPLLAGLAFFIGRVADALFDPVVGHWSDLRARARRRKAMIGWSIIPTLGSFVLMWVLPVQVTGDLLQFLIATAAFTLFTLGYTMLTLPRLAMLPGFEPDYHGRTTQVSYDLIFAFIAIGVAMAGLPALIGAFGGGTMLSDVSASAWVASLGLLAFVAGLAYLPFLLLFVEPSSATGPARPPLWVFLRSFWRSDLAAMAVIFFLSVVSVVSVQSMLPFFLELRIGVPPAGHALLLGLVFATVIGTFPLWSLLSKRIGKRRGLIAGALVYCSFLLLVPLIPAQVGITPLLLLSCIIAGAGVAAQSLFTWSLIPDMVEHHCRLHGAGQEGLCTAAFTMTNKLAIGTAVLLNAGLLAAGGSDAGVVTAATGPVPMIICLVMLLLVRRWVLIDAGPDRSASSA